MSKLYHSNDSYSTYNSYEFTTPTSSQIESPKKDTTLIEISTNIPPTSSNQVSRYTSCNQPAFVDLYSSSDELMNYYTLQTPPHIPTPIESPRLEIIPEDDVFPKKKNLLDGFFDCMVEMFKCNRPRKKK